MDKLAIREALHNYHIIVDAGHGWDTAGKRSTDDSLRENEFNSAVQDKVGFMLGVSGVSYTMLANGWKDENLNDRVNEEHRIFSETGKTVLGISIHADAFTEPTAHGITTFYYSKSGKELGISIHDKIMHRNIENKTIVKNRGVRQQNFAMLKRTKGIWILLESGFMTNVRDLNYLLRDSYRNELALSIVEGFVNYSNKSHR